MSIEIKVTIVLAALGFVITFAKWMHARLEASEERNRRHTDNQIVELKTMVEEIEKEGLSERNELRERQIAAEREAIERFVLRKEWDRQDARLDRIESKIDRLIETRP